MTTQMHRITVLLMVAVMVGLIAAGWILVAQPQLAAAAASDAQRASVQSQLASSQRSLRQLQTQKSKLGELTTQLTGLQRSIPSSLASSSLVAGINDEAQAAGVSVVSIAVNDPVVYAPAGEASAATSTSSAASPSSTASATAPPSSTGSGSFSPETDPRITPANFVPVPVTITVSGGWNQVLAFTKNLQGGVRLFALGTLTSKLGDSSSYGGAADPSAFTTTITGYVFAITNPTATAGTSAKVARSTPTSTKKQTPSPSSTPTPSGTPSR